jgi:hypothetical protein
MRNITFVIAGVRITVWTNHRSDIECLQEMFRYHEADDRPDNAEHRHEVVITSSKERLMMPAGMPLIWSGCTQNTSSVKWYNPAAGVNGNVILIAEDILVRHLPGRNLTLCCLSETGLRFSKSRRPLLSNYMFFLLHSIASMYGKYCVHAACASKDGYAYLFIGRSGSGKTTISEILGKAGWKYMGDDLVFISQNKDGVITVDSFLSKAKIFNERQTAKKSVDVIGEWDFHYDYRQPLRCVVKLQRTEASEKSILIPATQPEAFIWILSAGNNIKIQYHPERWMNICEKSSLLPAYTLMFADKKHFDPAVLNTALQ